MIQGLSALDPPLGGSALTVGNFDGVHRAHQKLLEVTRALARESRVPGVVLTFDPHPLTVVAPAKAPARLTTLADKLSHLEAGGVAVTVVARSEPALLTLNAEAFVKDVVVERFHPLHVIEGPTFGFGRGRTGTPELLATLAPRLGYQLHIVAPVTVELDDGSQAMISSSLVRKLLGDGQVEKAAECLTRPYTLTGCVVPGRALGRRIGFPTANLAPSDQVVPGDGVYAGRAVVEQGDFPCAINVGFAPTFGVHERRVEAHLLDFDGALYGQTMRLTFLRRLRGQQKFASASDLAEQLLADVHAVRETAHVMPRAHVPASP